MHFLSAIFVPSLLVVVKALEEEASTAGSCTPTEIEVLFLFEGSGQNQYVWYTFGDKIADLASSLDTYYKVPPNYSIATFVDKPSVHVGSGKYGGWPEMWGMDWCYDLAAPMMDNTKIRNGLREFGSKQRSGLGLDIEQAQLEAVIRGATDKNVGWKHEKAHPGYKKVIVLTVDSLPHTPDWAEHGLADYVNAFNAPLTCDSDNHTHGGFGANISTVLPLFFWTAYEEQYREYTPLVEKLMCRNESLTRDELILYRERKGLLWPEHIPDVRPYNLTVLMENPEEHCRYHEYPSYPQLVDVLEEYGVSLIVPIFEWENLTGFDVAIAGWNWITTQLPEGSINLQVVNISLHTQVDQIIFDGFKALIPKETCDH